MKLYYPIPPSASHFVNGPFRWSYNYGEGDTAGVRITAGGTNKYHVIRPRWPLPINDGISLQVQARVRSELNLTGANQGVALQVRGLKFNGREVTVLYDNEPDVNTELWYTRKKSDFELLTAVIHLPAGSGITHLLVEPMVHAFSGFADITSVRLRSFYHNVYEREIAGPSTVYNDGSNNLFERIVASRAMSITKGQEFSIGIDSTHNIDYGAFIIAWQVHARRVSDGVFDKYSMATISGSSGNDIETSGERNFRAKDTYDLLRWVFITIDFNSPSGNVLLKDMKFDVNTKDIITSGS